MWAEQMGRDFLEGTLMLMMLKHLTHLTRSDMHFPALAALAAGHIFSELPCQLVH